MAKAQLPSGQTLKWKDDNFPSVYANIMGFSMSPFDISLLFGEIGEATATEVSAIPKSKVILSPEQAANLMKLLGAALQTYVENNGKLRMSGAVDLEQINSQLDASKVVKQ